MDTDLQEPLSDLDVSEEDEAEVDEALDDAAQGANATADEAGDEGTGEIDAIGHAAGMVVRDDKPFRGIDEVERRDQHRWELDPASADPTDS